MIGKIKGIVDSLDLSSVIVDVAGVGYLLHCSSKALSNMRVGERVELFAETYVREDQITLYGFSTQSEKKCFLKLITVKGVGPRLALQILSCLTPDQILLALTSQDSAIFSKISGVGPKLINRIFTELKDKDFADLTSGNSIQFSNVVEGLSSIKMDAISALVNLGIAKSEAYTVVSKIIAERENVDLNNLIKLSLSSVSR